MKKVFIPESKFPRIVVVGAGFAGLHFILKMKNKPFQIVLVDKNNFHQFQPLLYQVATSGLEPDSIIFSVRKIFRKQNNFLFRMGEVDQIIEQENKIITNIGEITYDHLVLATGANTNFYGMEDVAINSIGLKSIQDALDIRSHILQNFEKAVNTPDLEVKRRFSTVVVVGGGPAGVEMAGALAEFEKYVYKNDYPDLGLNPLKVILIEAGDKLLPAMSNKSSLDTLDYLSKLEVIVKLNTAVKKYDGSKAILSTGETIESESLIWTAGVKGQCPRGIKTDVIVRGNRLRVDHFNKLHGTSNIFVIGDVAFMTTEAYPNGHPMVAPTAIQQGEHLADNLIWKKWVPFVYHDKGALATIGKKKAVADINKIHFKGFFAWLIWSIVHLMSISGFKNRARVGLNWLNSYFSYDKHNRVIIRKYKK